MKKIYLSSFLFLITHLFCSGQVEIGFKAGLTDFWLKPNPNYTTAFFMGGHNGLEVKLSVPASALSLTLAYEQHGNVSALNFWAWQSTADDEVIAHDDRRIERYQLIPVLLGYRIKSFEFYGGYAYKIVGLDFDEKYPEMEAYHWTESGMIAGLEYRFFKNWAASFNCYFGGIGAPQLPNNRIISRISSGISMKYYLPLFKDRTTETIE